MYTYIYIYCFCFDALPGMGMLSSRASNSARSSASCCPSIYMASLASDTTCCDPSASPMHSSPSSSPSVAIGTCFPLRRALLTAGDLVVKIKIAFSSSSFSFFTCIRIVCLVVVGLIGLIVLFFMLYLFTVFISTPLILSLFYLFPAFTSAFLSVWFECWLFLCP